jgi:thiol-disulfide isomerase/thioredoxin
MKAKGSRSWLFLLPFLCLGALQSAFAEPPAKGGLLPAFSLEIPKDPAAKAYLGLRGEGLFKIPQIQADVVIIEIFSLYCPYCQSIAPGMKEFYTLIEKDPNLKGRIKIIGIGAGNTPFEVDIFKKTFETPFPLFADKDFVIHKALGSVRTPYFIAVKIKDGEKHEVILSDLAPFKDAPSFLQTIRSLAGLP